MAANAGHWNINDVFNFHATVGDFGRRSSSTRLSGYLRTARHWLRSAGAVHSPVEQYWVKERYQNFRAGLQQLQHRAGRRALPTSPHPLSYSAGGDCFGCRESARASKWSLHSSPAKIQNRAGCAHGSVASMCCNPITTACRIPPLAGWLLTRIFRYRRFRAALQGGATPISWRLCRQYQASVRMINRSRLAHL